MSKLFFTSLMVVLFAMCFRPSFENRSRRRCSIWYSDPKCRREGKICCNGACNSTCIGKRCRWDFQCGSDKCCSGYCRQNCEGYACRWDSNCKDRSMKCCNRVCRKESCLGSECDGAYRAYHTCGWHRGKRLDCCGGKCELSCQDKSCFDNNDCGRMKCCGGTCKRNCLGSSCFEHKDCQSSTLDCCGFFMNKTCARSCLDHDCSLAEKSPCGRPGVSRRLFCCGDGKCHSNCRGSICYTETFRYDCQAPGRLLYCCGMGQKECRISCSHVRCEKNEDCGTSNYYCGRPNRYNVSTCTTTYPGDIISWHDVRLEDLNLGG